MALRVTAGVTCIGATRGQSLTVWITDNLKSYGVRVSAYGFSHRRTHRPRPRLMIDHGSGVIAHGTGVIDHALSHQ
jgi:hypothetical protein